MSMWVATRTVETPCGTVAAGRLVADGDPMLIGVPEGAFVRVVDDGDVVVNINMPAKPEVMAQAVVDEAAAIVEEATAEPGKRRRSLRKAAD